MNKLPRMIVSIVLSIILGIAVANGSPQQLPVALFKFYLVTGAAVAGYYLDRELFPYARPDLFEVGGRDVAFVGAQIRRAIIVGCMMLSVGLGA
ncbi:MAG: putative holin [Rhodocyclaceae bacterium]|nr:putative holin [Rhodocyclaceae bacterium]